MNNATQRTHHPVKQVSLTTNDSDPDQTDEARLAAKFSRLYHQYRRAGYEYHQRTQQANSEETGKIPPANDSEQSKQ